MAEKVAILLDGGFVKKRLIDQVGRFPLVSEVVAVGEAIMGHDRLKDKELFRVFFYDAPPFGGASTNPITGKVMDWTKTKESQQNQALLDALELEADFAVRRGVLANRGWKLGKFAFRRLRENKKLRGGDVLPDFEQKGVDLRIGLDIASISLKRAVEVVVIVSGDSDLIPAMKFARKEGLRVYLEPMQGPIRAEMRAHADFVF
jgi:uncharacterized LabA/DUF88 family protein